ncbi:MAG TPA: hypothetical protein V6D22_19395 [Candidatus Obscuribacterales bacterium]
MNARIQLFAVSALLVTVAAGVGAQNSPHKGALPAALGNVSAACDKNCENMAGLISTVQEAKKSGDVKKMKAALDMAEQQLTGVKNRTDRTNKIAQRLKEHMDRIEEQRDKVHQEQSKLDQLFYPTDEFVIGE